jgi:hypothetical protein
MIHIQSFRKTDTGVQAILRFRLSNLNACNVGITNGRDLCSAPLTWSQMP